eukprot:jgi/Botrbrau1/15177/Bobra.0149s0042.1
MVVVPSATSRTACLVGTMRERFDNREYIVPQPSVGGESTGFHGDVPRGRGPLSERWKHSGRPPLGRKKGKRSATICCKARKQAPLFKRQNEIFFLRRKVTFNGKPRRLQGTLKPGLTDKGYAGRGMGKGMDTYAQPTYIDKDSPSVGACPNAPDNTNTFLVERKGGPSCSPADIHFVAKAGGFEELDAQVASLATNLDFAGSNYGSNIGDMVLQQPIGAVFPSPQLHVFELEGAWAPPMDGGMDGPVTPGQLVARIQELERQVLTLNRRLEEERLERKVPRINELEEQVMRLCRQLEEEQKARQRMSGDLQT